MNAITAAAQIRRPPVTPKKSFVRALFSSPLNAFLTVVAGYIIVQLGSGIVGWAILDAALFPIEPATCKEATGACWSFVAAKFSQILFGIYPFDQRWRPALVCIGLLALLLYSMRRTSWRPQLFAVWMVAIVGVFVLMFGGVFGLDQVPTSMWGGLPVTLILTVVAIGLAFPLAVLLAMARRSNLPVVKSMAVVFIETTRSLPLLSILFIASIMLPLMLPEAILPDKFTRALVALLLFASAYLAEVIRGGLQSLPKGQIEASAALGMTYWQAHRFIILPQAINVVIPALANTVIVMIKNTSLVLVVGLFDLISSGKAALADPEWASPAVETYIFIAAIYFSLCFGFGRFADSLERRNKVSTS